MSADLLTAAAAVLDDAIDLRRRIHRRPELGLENPITQELILDALDGIGVGGLRTGQQVTSVVGVIEGDRPGRTVLLRADTDALPMPEDTGLEFASEVDGAMHACGHDAHVAMLVGAARLLQERRGQLAGRVVLMFQPGEEGHHGARYMIEEGLLEGDTRPDAAFAIHQSPSFGAGIIATRPGPLLAAADKIDVRFAGKGGHASQPHFAVDPIPVAAEFVTALQAMVTRRVDAFDPAVVSITKLRAGTTNNVIPEDALMQGTVRTFSARTRGLVHEGLHRLAGGIAQAHGCTAELTITPHYPVTVNDGEQAAFASETATAIVGEDAVIDMPAPVMGAEDFSYVLERVPGAMVFLGTRPEGMRSRDTAPNHSNRMVLNEAAMATGIAFHTAVALRFCS